MSSALVIVATAGANTANSYVTLADADAILLGYISAVTSVWDAATDAQCNAALVQATRDIDTYRLKGTKYYSSEDEQDTDDWQPLHFPVAEHYSDSTGGLFIPESVEKACAVQAAYLLRAGAEQIAVRDMVSAGIRSNQAGRLSQTYDRHGECLCDEARALLHDWIITSVRIERG